MKKLTLFALLLVSNSLLAQWPYFQQDHSSLVAGVDYSASADMEFDGVDRVYSYHASAAGGLVIAKYATGNGAIASIAYLSRNGHSYDPVRIRVTPKYIYALFNMKESTSGTTRYCLAKLDATANTLLFVRQFSNLGNTLDAYATDFIIDGSLAYILGTAFDPATSQYDVFVTKADVSNAAPAVLWNRVYQRTSRDEYASNIILFNNELYASYNDANPMSLNDRGPGLLKLDINGNYLNSRIYKYNKGCSSVRTSKSWVMASGPNQLTFSSTSFVGADGNGPLWLANIDPATLMITQQAHHSSGSAYLMPEIQNVATAAGNRILMSGAEGSVNVRQPAYVHYFFDPATLAFSSGARYTTMDPGSWFGQIHNAYISSGTGMNIFTVADKGNATNSYYLLKTSDAGANGCNSAVSILPAPCTLEQYPVAFTTVSNILTFPVIAPFSVSTLSNVRTQPCFVCPICPRDEIDPVVPLAEMPMNTESEQLHEIGVTLYPNPTTGTFAIQPESGSLTEVQVRTLTGAEIAAPIRVGETGVVVDLSAEQPGIYLVEALLNGERRSWRVAKN